MEFLYIKIFNLSQNFNSCLSEKIKNIDNN